MNLKTLLGTTEGLIVLGGLFATVTLGKLFAWLTAIAYLAFKIPSFYQWLKNWYNKGKDLVDGE